MWCRWALAFSCTRPSKNKSGSQTKQSTKGKGRSSQTPTSAKHSSSAKAKAQPKKDGAKGSGKGKKDKSSTKPSTKPSTKSSAKSSTKTSAKSGEVSFDNDDAEEEDPDAEYTWGEEEECVEEEQQEPVDLVADHAFATPYHSHVGEVHDSDDVAEANVESTVVSGRLQLDATSEENWTTDDEAIDTPGMTHAPNSPSSAARFSATNSSLRASTTCSRSRYAHYLSQYVGRDEPRLGPIVTAQDLLHNSDDSSESLELLSSEEEPDKEEYYTNSEEGFPNIQRVLTYPARLTEEGGVERIGPVEDISEADPSGHQLDQDQWFAHRSDSDFKGRACAHTAASISLPASTKDSWEWRGSCCLVRVHRQARRCLFTPTWKEDIWHGFTVYPTRKSYVTPVGQKKHLNPVIENVKLCSSLKPRRVAYSWTGETHFKVDPDMCGKRVFRMSARILVPANDMNPASGHCGQWCLTRYSTHVCVAREEGRQDGHLTPGCRTGAQWSTIEKSSQTMSLYLCVH